MASLSWKVVGAKEDVSDVIVNIAPDETVCINRFGKTSATAMYHEWLLDSLRPAKVNKNLEKADFSTVEATPRTRMGNYIQHFMHGYYVTDATEKVLKYGVKSEISYQMVKAAKELARDMELAVFKNSTQARGASSTPGSEGVTGGVRYFAGGRAQTTTVVAATNLFTAAAHGFITGEMVSLWSDNTLPAPLTSSGIYYVGVESVDTFKLYLTSIDAQAGTNVVDITDTGVGTHKIDNVNVVNAAGALTEQLFNDLVQKIWQGGATPKDAYMSGKRKRQISGWTAGTMKTRDQSERQLITVIDVYESDFGIVNLNVHRMQDDSRIDFIDEQYYKLAYLVPTHIEDVPRKGTYTEKCLDSMFAVENKCPQAHGAIIGITG